MTQNIKNKEHNQTNSPLKTKGTLPPIILPANKKLEGERQNQILPSIQKQQKNFKPQTINVVKEQTESHQYSLCLGLVACFGGLFVQLVIGSLYQWGIINIYITSYYKLSDPSVSLEKNAVVFPAMMLCIGLTMRIGIWISDTTHPLVVLFGTAILMSASIFISSFMPNFIGFIMFYGVAFGFIAGLVFMIPIIECNKYLIGRKMMVNGIILIGTGIGSLVFGLFSYNYLNPDKLQPEGGYYLGTTDLQDIARKTPNCLRFLALLYIIIGLIGSFMLLPVTIINRGRQNKQRQQKKNQKQKLKRQRQAQGGQVIDQGQEIVKKGDAATICEACSTRLWWIKVIINILGSCGVFLINGNYKTYVKETISDDQFLTIIGVIASVGNGVSRIFWNLLFSKTGYKTVMLLNLSINIFVFVIIRFTVNTPPLYLIMVFLINCCLGGFLVKTPTFLQALFGHKVGSNAYGFYWTIFGISNMIAYAYVAGLSPLIGFNGVIYICLGMCFLAIPFVVFTFFQGHWENDTQHLGFCSCCWNKGIEPEQSHLNEQSFENMISNKQINKIASQLGSHQKKKIQQPQQTNLPKQYKQSEQQRDTIHQKKEEKQRQQNSNDQEKKEI